MAVAYDAGSNSGNALVVGSSNTWAHTCGASATVLVVGTIVRDSVNAVTGITYNSVALTKLNSAQDGGSNHRVELWYLLNPTTGSSQNIVASWAGSESTLCCASSYTGAGTPLNFASNSANDTNDLSVSVTSATNDMVVDIATKRWSEVFSVGAGQTQVANMTNASQQGGMSYEAGAASVTMSWTWSHSPNRDWLIAGASVPVASAGAGKNLLLLGVGT